MFSLKQPVPVFVINLRKREDRRKHIVEQFSGHKEFRMSLVEAVENTSGAAGLLETIKYIIRSRVNTNENFILICEDDHQFTENYNWNTLAKCISEAMKREADILLGGVSSIRKAIPITNALWWVDDFSGLQFTVLFRKFFQVILDTQLMESEPADHKIASIAANKFLIFPFISTQKEFGYSDVTLSNNEVGRVGSLFANAAEAMLQLSKVDSYYHSTVPSVIPEFKESDLDTIALAVYVINLPDRRERLEHIRSQFSGRREFEVTIVEASTHNRGATGLWTSIRRIIQMAQSTDEDLIVICEDDHTFTDHYDKRRFIRNVIEAHLQGADILAGGICGGFNHALPISENRFWVNHFHCTQFIVIYRKLFQKILDEPFDEETVTADDHLSIIASNKQVLYPFISVQKDFGYSDVTALNNAIEGRTEGLFTCSDNQLQHILRAYSKRSIL